MAGLVPAIHAFFRLAAGERSAIQSAWIFAGGRNFGAICHLHGGLKFRIPTGRPAG
jgi:hypothetical protein